MGDATFPGPGRGQALCPKARTVRDLFHVIANYVQSLSCPSRFPAVPWAINNK